jgi:hypothetical protein
VSELEILDSDRKMIKFCSYVNTFDDPVCQVLC